MVPHSSGSGTGRLETSQNVAAPEGPHVPDLRGELVMQVRAVAARFPQLNAYLTNQMTDGIDSTAACAALNNIFRNIFIASLLRMPGLDFERDISSGDVRRFLAQRYVAEDDPNGLRNSVIRACVLDIVGFTEAQMNLIRQLCACISRIEGIHREMFGSK